MKKNEMTVDILFKKVWELHWSKPSFQSSQWGKNVWSLYHKHIQPTLGTIPVNKIYRADIRKWYSQFEQDVYSGNRSMSVLKTLFRYGMEYDICLMHTDPTLGIKRFREVQRDRYASEEELKRLYLYLEKMEVKRPKQVAFIRALLLTGSRPKALTKIKATDFIELGNGWYEVKFNGKCHAESLLFSPAAKLNIDKAIGINLRSVQNFWKYMQKNIPALKDLWLRDLRRTFATIGLSNGVSVDHIGRLLNHTDPKITLRYAKLVDDAKKNGISQISEVLEKIHGNQVKAVS